ncbi:MAG: hypothetical protein ABRQ39_14350 [Candidatus Eremiobacterota bacterium]
MSDPAIKAKLMEQIEYLSPEFQMQLLNFARKLAGIKGTPGKDLLPFAGIMTLEESQEISRVIEEDCEKVEMNEW